MMADEKKMPIVGEAEAPSETVTETAVQDATEVVAAETAADAPVAEAAEQNISEKLKAAAGNIRRADAGARARKSEQEKDRKQTEAEAQARLEDAEKKLKADREKAKLVAEQKLAALNYAQNYRKKLQKDREKAMSAAKAREKAEREAEEAKAREARAQEIAALLEKEREEARARGEKATELLNRVTKCAVVDENGNLRMVDKMDLLKEKAENERAEAEAKAAALAEEALKAEALAKAEAAARREAAKVAPVAEDKADAARREVEDFLVGEMMTVEGDSFVLNIEDEDMTVSLTNKDDPAIIPESMIPADMPEEEPEEAEDADECKFAKALADHEAALRMIQESTKLARDEMARMLADEQERFAKEMEAIRAHRDELVLLQEQRRRSMLEEIAALTALAAAKAPAEEKKEEPASEPEEEKILHKPVISNDPIVEKLRKMGEAVMTKRQLKKYVKKSKKAIKKIEKKIETYEAARRISDEERSRAALCYSMNECGKILEIRCDNLAAAARLRNDKFVKKLRLMLYSQIERFNRKATEFAAETGEMLTRVSAFLPDHITNQTGKAVIPVLAYRDRYEQLTPDDPEIPKSYIVSFPSVTSLKSGETAEAVSSVVAVGGEKKKNPITTKVIVESALLERDLLANKPEVTSKKSFKKLRKLAKKANKTIDKKVKSLGGIVTPEKAVAALLLERERVLVGSRVLIGAVKLGKAKYIGEERIKLEELFGRYNKAASACDRICNTTVTKIHPLTASKVAEAMLIPDMPLMVHVNELFETVGDTTRIVGDPSGKKASDPDGSFTFLIGGSKVTVAANAANSPAAEKTSASGGASAKVNEGQHYPVKGMPYPPMCMGAYVDVAPERKEAVADGKRYTVVSADKVDPLRGGVLSGAKLAAFKKENNRLYKESKKQLSEIERARATARGDERFELDVRALVVEKELIDTLAEGVFVADSSKDGGFLKKSRKRLLEEIEVHNALVDDLGLIGGVKFSHIPDSFYSEIVSGKGYHKTPKIEYQVVEQPSVQKVSAVSSAAVVETAGAAAGAAAVLSGKELSRYAKNSEKTYASAKARIEEQRRAIGKKSGEELVKAELDCIVEHRALIDMLCESLAVAGASGDARFVKSTEARLAEQIKKHNEAVDSLNAKSGTSVSRLPVSIIDDISKGKGYRKCARLEFVKAPAESIQQISSPAAAMSKKELKSYKAESAKAYAASEKTVAGIESSYKGKSGEELMQAEIAGINARRERIDALCNDLVVARGAEDKAFIASTKKKLADEIKSHNAAADAFSKKNGTEASKLSSSVIDDILSGKGYVKAPRLEYRIDGEEEVLGAAAPEVKMYNLTSGAVSSPVLSGKEMKKHVKVSSRKYKELSDEAAALAKSSRSAKGAERIDVDLKALTVRKEIIDGLCETAAIAQSSGNAKLLKETKKKLEAEISAHNALVDEIAKLGVAPLSKAPADLYDQVTSGKGYRKVPKISLEIAEHPTSQLIYNQSASADGKSSAKGADEGSHRDLYVSGEVGKKELSARLKSNEKKLKTVSAQLEDLETKKRAAVGVEKHKLLVSQLNAQRAAAEAEASSLVYMVAAGSAKGQIAKQKKKVEAELKAYNSLADEYAEFTGDKLSGADVQMAEKIVNGQPFTRIKELEVAVFASGYDYQYANYDGYDANRDAQHEFAVARAQAEAEKQNAISYELASLKNQVKRQADKDNRAVAAAFMYAKGLIQCEDDARNYSYGITKKVERRKSENIVARCKKIDRTGKAALNAENEANKRYYEVVTTHPDAVPPVGKKRRWKAIPFFRKKYTKQDITYLRDEIMKLLNERDRINGLLISIYEGQVMDLGGRPLTFDIRQVKAQAAKRMHNNKSIKAMAKKVDKRISDPYDRETLYGYINDQIEAESNIAVIEYRLKHAKDDNLTPYEIKQLKYDREAQIETQARAHAQFKRTYQRCLPDNDSGLGWLAGIGLMLLVLGAIVAGFIWLFGSGNLENLGSFLGFFQQ